MRSWRESAHNIRSGKSEDIDWMNVLAKIDGNDMMTPQLLWEEYYDQLMSRIFEVVDYLSKPPQ